MLLARRASLSVIILNGSEFGDRVAFSSAAPIRKSGVRILTLANVFWT
jgi:hypothetical protein